MRCSCQQYSPSVGPNVWQRFEGRFATSAHDTIVFPFPLEPVWSAIPKTVADLGWKVTTFEPSIHRIIARAKASLFAWSSTLIIDVSAADSNSSSVHVIARTGQAHDYGKTRKRIDLFFRKLEEQPLLTAFGEVR